MWPGSLQLDNPTVNCSIDTAATGILSNTATVAASVIDPDRRL
jgi:hypothetical protein